MTETAARAKGRRLSPEDRRNQLLDCARTIILERGLSTLTMELLAAEAGVSNPLIYKYFASRLELLQAVLEQALLEFGASVEQQLSDVEDYEDIVRVFVTTNFDQFSRGSIINLLLSQPDVRERVRDVEGKRAGHYLVRELRKRYDVSARHAEQLVVLGAGASQAAAERYANSPRRRQTMIEDTVRFIVAGIEALVMPREL
ncbi:MAG: TetR/AcrR family transcriptional regulator [Pseudomonadota bacterium]